MKNSLTLIMLILPTLAFANAPKRLLCQVDYTVTEDGQKVAKFFPDSATDANFENGKAEVYRQTSLGLKYIVSVLPDETEVTFSNSKIQSTFIGPAITEDRTEFKSVLRFTSEENKMKIGDEIAEALAIKCRIR